MKVMGKKGLSLLVDWIRRNEFLVVLILLIVLARVPSLFEPGWYGDEGIYLVLGAGLRKGLLWYKEIHDNKPPLLYLLAAVAGSVTYFRALLLVWMIATTVVFNRLSKKLIGEGFWQKISLSLMALLSTLPWLEGHIANAEIFMMLPTMLGVLLLVENQKKIKKNRWKYALSGLCFSMAFLFKVPVIFELIGIVLFWVLIKDGIKGLWKALGKAHWYWMLAGFLVPVIVSIVYYYLKGAGVEYVVAAFLQNVGYLSSWKTGSMTRSGSSTESGLMMRGLVLMVMVVFFAWRSRKMGWQYRMVVVWFLFALFGALLSERPYPHYLILAVSSGSLMIGLSGKNLRRWIWTGGMLLILVEALIKYGFYFYPVVDYYGKFLHLLKGRISYEEYADSFDWRVRRTRDLTKELKEITDPGEKIFVWGDEPFVYFESETLPVGRYTVAYHIIDFEAKEETMEKLKEENPRVVINMVSEKRPFDEFHAWRESYYGLSKVINDAEIYVRVENNEEVGVEAGK